MFRICLSAFVLGTACVHGLAAVPSWQVSACVLAVCLLAIIACRSIDTRAWNRHICVACLAALFLLGGAALTAARVDLRLADVLAADRENVPVQLVFRVSGLASVDERSQRFEATLIRPPPGLPHRVLLSWYAKAGKLATIVPGQVWRASVRLKRPNGTLNPHGFDYEAHLFAQGIRATGSVGGTPRLIGDQPFASFGVLVQRIRHRAREALQAPLRGARYGPVIVALAMGDQAGVDKEDWRVFNRTGITHLVSISGMHVTMVAALAGAAALAGWKRWSWRGVALPERTPAQIVAAAAALIVAWIYCLLAGWGLPAQRTFFMLAVVAGAAMLRLPLSGSRVLILAAALVCALDSWAPLSVGFWLSFGAVGMLILAGSGRWRRASHDAHHAHGARWRRLLRSVHEGCRLQLVMTIGMVPLLALLFQQVSLVSPLANALAIPVVSLVVTPLSLAALALCALPGLEGPGSMAARAAHGVFESLMLPVRGLADIALSSHPVAAAPWPLVALACGGVAWALQPRGLPGRAAALLLLLPVLTYRPARPHPGDWRLTALDVGQGSAIVVETANATVLFDTGPKYGDADAGERIVWPYLRSRGISSLQQLMVSHGDMDHAGGVQSVLNALPVEAVRASYDLPQTLAPGASRENARHQWSFTRCVAGQHWDYDGVGFSILHPLSASASASVSKDRNASSCVLKIQGANHSALLTGDIGSPEERRLARLDDIDADVVMAAHHGSRSASSAAFAAAVRPGHAVAQAGYLNRYGHPHPDAIRRWESAGSLVHRTDRHGAIVFESRGGSLTAIREREVRRRVWHLPDGAKAD